MPSKLHGLTLSPLRIWYSRNCIWSSLSVWYLRMSCRSESISPVTRYLRRRANTDVTSVAMGPAAATQSPKEIWDERYEMLYQTASTVPSESRTAVIHCCPRLFKTPPCRLLRAGWTPLIFGKTEKCLHWVLPTHAVISVLKVKME